MQSIKQTIIETICDTKYPLCVGIDPHISMIPEYFYKEDEIQTIYYFSKGMLDCLKCYTSFIKIQIAIFERYGSRGIGCLEKILVQAHKHEYIVMIDAKRSDIPSTSQYYAEAYLNPQSPLNCHILTVTPYMGIDSIYTYLEVAYKYNKMICLVLTSSNNEGNKIQKYIYHQILCDLERYTHYRNNLCFVIGNSSYKIFPLLHQKTANDIIFIPGIGYQKKTIQNHADLIQSRKKYKKIPLTGIIPCSSRAILFPQHKEKTDSLKKWQNNFHNNIQSTINYIKTYI